MQYYGSSGVRWRRVTIEAFWLRDIASFDGAIRAMVSQMLVCMVGVLLYDLLQYEYASANLSFRRCSDLLNPPVLGQRKAHEVMFCNDTTHRWQTVSSQIFRE